jgi:hypothetical protein
LRAVWIDHWGVESQSDSTDHNENQNKAFEITVAVQDVGKDSDFVFRSKYEERTAIDLKVYRRPRYDCLIFNHVVV